MTKTILVLALLAGCGGGELRISYAAETARCMRNERAIVDRTGTTAEQDHADLDSERARCAAALAAIEHGDAP